MEGTTVMWDLKWNGRDYWHVGFKMEGRG